MNDNKGVGRLRIRAYLASEAYPAIGLKVVVSTIFNGNRIIFFDGDTDNSGMINVLSLPTPIYNNDDLVAPASITYLIDVNYLPDNSIKTFTVNMYDDVCVVQNILITPEIKEIKYGD